jgi:lipoyl(octanoyl) transferase
MNSTATVDAARARAGAQDPPAGASRRALVVRRRGRVDYAAAYDEMRRFSAARDAATPDELWVLEHPPVYTLGQAGKAEHLLRATSIPVRRVDRGGQITYHGPGQVVAYVLLDLRRRGLTVKRLVCLLEQAVIDVLASHGLQGERRPGAPGVYVGGAKIAALGLRVRGGASYHGLALNVNLDLGPYADINPCGYEGLAVTRLADLGVRETPEAVGDAFVASLQRLLEAEA